MPFFCLFLDPSYSYFLKNNLSSTVQQVILSKFYEAISPHRNIKIFTLKNFSYLRKFGDRKFDDPKRLPDGPAIQIHRRNSCVTQPVWTKHGSIITAHAHANLCRSCISSSPRSPPPTSLYHWSVLGVANLTLYISIPNAPWKAMRKWTFHITVA